MSGAANSDADVYALDFVFLYHGGLCMKLPKEILVLSTTYAISRQKDLAKDEGLDGYADPRSRKIVLDDELKGDYLTRVFWHEVGHCFAFESGLHDALSHPSAVEMFAENFGAFLSQIKP